MNHGWKIIRKYPIEETITNTSNVQNVFENEEREIILCIGKVQSGKTSIIFDCIEHAIEKLKYDFVILFGGTTNYLFDQTNVRIEKSLKKKINDNVIYWNVDKINSGYKINDNHQYVINLLKHSDSIEAINNKLRNVYNLHEKKILIIDDEADYASINIDKDNGSKIYKGLVDLFSKVTLGKILQVTATPFANIITKNSDIKIDKIVCWDHYPSYQGLNEFDQNKDVNYEIIDGDKKTYEKAIDKTIRYFIKTIIVNWTDLKNIMDNSNKHELTCLINIDLDTNNHKEVEKIVKENIRDIQSYKLIYYDNWDIKKYCDFETFKQRLNEFFKEFDTHILNSKDKAKKKQEKKFKVYIGGTLISRGNTFDNLIAELILNSPTKTQDSVDTLLQRCRWFGNRESIMPFMKIFMNQKIYNALIEAKAYVNLLNPGIHKLNDLLTEITFLDQQSKYVKSTNKE